MTVYEPLRGGLTSTVLEESNVHGRDKPNGFEGMATAFVPPKPFKCVSRSRRHRSWVYCRGTLLMSFSILVPLLLYSPAVASNNIGPGRRAIDICSPELKFPSFFEPDILMGNFTLGQAKAIDLGWNTVIGRGSQALMTWGSYDIVMQGLTRMAETTTIRYDVFTSLVFHPTSLTSTWSLIKGLPSLKGWRPKFAFAWLVYAFVLTAIISILFDTSSGYARSNGLMYFSGESVNGTYYGPFETLPSIFGYGRDNRDSLVYNCLPDSSYQWGFVSGWIFIVYPLLSIWVFGMYVLWVDAQHNSNLTRKGWRGGEWRGLVDIAGAVSRELGPDIGAYSSAELGKLLKERPPLSYVIEEDTNGLHSVRLESQ
jgi:hypothetical protein